MKKIYRNILFFIFATFSLTVHAEQGAEEFLDAIVEIRISVPENARTAERFGINNKQEVHGMADFYRKVWALGKGGVDVPLRILQGIQIRDIVVHSTARSQYEQPVQSSVEL